jgi:hypothetical protein
MDYCQTGSPVWIKDTRTLRKPFWLLQEKNMKTLFKIALVVLIFVVNLAIAQPSLADRPKVSKNPDYIQVTKTLNGYQHSGKARVSLPNCNSELTS